MIKSGEKEKKTLYSYVVLITFFIVSTRVHQVHLVFRDLLELLDLLYVLTAHTKNYYLWHFAYNEMHCDSD